MLGFEFVRRRDSVGATSVSDDPRRTVVAAVAGGRIRRCRRRLERTSHREVAHPSETSTRLLRRCFHPVARRPPPLTRRFTSADKLPISRRGSLPPRRGVRLPRLLTDRIYSDLVARTDAASRGVLERPHPESRRVRGVPYFASSIVIQERPRPEGDVVFRAVPPSLRSG